MVEDHFAVEVVKGHGERTPLSSAGPLTRASISSWCCKGKSSPGPSPARRANASEVRAVVSRPDSDTLLVEDRRQIVGVDVAQVKRDEPRPLVLRTVDDVVPSNSPKASKAYATSSSSCAGSPPSRSLPIIDRPRQSRWRRRCWACPLRISTESRSTVDFFEGDRADHLAAVEEGIHRLQDLRLAVKHADPGRAAHLMG